MRNIILKQPVVFRATGLRQVTLRFFITFYTYTIKRNGKLRHQVSVLEPKFKKTKADGSKSCDIILSFCIYCHNVITLLSNAHIYKKHLTVRSSIKWGYTIDHKYLENFKLWYWRRMEQFS
jgi:hypothetical protein